MKLFTARPTQSQNSCPLMSSWKWCGQVWFIWIMTDITVTSDFDTLAADSRTICQKQCWKYALLLFGFSVSNNNSTVPHSSFQKPFELASPCCGFSTKGWSGEGWPWEKKPVSHVVHYLVKLLVEASVLFVPHRPTQVVHHAGSLPARQTTILLECTVRCFPLQEQINQSINQRLYFSFEVL